MQKEIKQSGRAEERLSKVELNDKSKAYYKELCGGKKQRISIAIALIKNPIVIFLEEPTTGLEPQARRNLWELIKEIKKQGITIMLTTHYMEEAQELCDRVAIINNGKKEAQDSPNNLIKEILDNGFNFKELHKKQI
jgi:ABC-type multidrug transport system, ATPase component